MPIAFPKELVIVLRPLQGPRTEQKLLTRAWLLRPHLKFPAVELRLEGAARDSESQSKDR